MDSGYLKFSSVMVIAAACACPAAAWAQTTPAPTPAPSATEKNSAIVVTGIKSDVQTAPDRLSFNVSNDLQVQTGTVADALRAVPGVEVDLQGGVSLRGDSGVKIMIDGRPSAMMNGDSRGDVLNSMPAGSIERVEVITNPSAAFSPEGSAGVINLVTKPARPGSRSATIRATIDPEGRGGLSLSGNSSKKGLTLSGDLGYRRFTGEQSGTQDRARYDSGTNSFVASSQLSDGNITMSGGQARLGLDYDVDKKNRLSTELNYRIGVIDLERTDRFISPTSAFVRTSVADMSQQGGGARASWRHTMGDGHEFVADLEYETGKMKRKIDAISTPGLPVGAATYERIGQQIDRNDYGLKFDYKRPMGEGQSLNVGYELDLGRSKFDLNGARGASFTSLTAVPILTTRFDFNQGVHALYGTFQFEVGKFDFQPGLRAEQVEFRIYQLSGGGIIRNDYFRVYPTLHVDYDVGAKQKLRGSYSRRIQRPSAQDLNPYTLYLDPLNLRRGNPNLKPEVTDSFELAWQKRDGSTFYSVTGFYRTSRGGVTDVFTNLGGGVLLGTRANLATSKRTGLELLLNGKLSKTLSYNASATVQRHEIDPRIAGIATPRDTVTGQVRANLSWQPTAKDFFQLGGFYAAKQLTAQGYRLGGGVLNLGYRRKINERFSLLLTGQNVLDSARQINVVETATIRDRIVQRGPGQVVMLGLTYTLGTQGAKKRPEPAFDFDNGAGAAAQ